MNKNNYIVISFLILIFVCIGLYYKNIVENLETPTESSSGEVSSGSSEYYGWGYTPIEENVVEPTNNEKKCPECNNIYIDETNICKYCNGGKRDCRFADITRNVNIDKYVLKSSVPPCPDLTEYAKKNQIPPYPFNINEWVRKSEIPPCPSCPNMDEWIRKSDVPAYKRMECPKCPVCPIAPICPKCSNETIVNEKIVYKNKPNNQVFINENIGYSPNQLSNYFQYNKWEPKFSELNE